MRKKLDKESRARRIVRGQRPAGARLCLAVLILTAGLVAAGVIVSRKVPSVAERELSYPADYPAGAGQIPREIAEQRGRVAGAKSVRLPIVMYHYIGFAPDANDKVRVGLTTSPGFLEQNIADLEENGFRFVTVREIHAMIKNGFSGRVAALTFDDGYEDFYRNAFPILKKHRVRATVFVMADYIGARGYLAEDQIRELVESNLVEIGAHTLDHRDLRSLPVKERERQVREDKAKLEKLLGRRIASFAYPYGGFSKEAIATVRAAGFTNAVSVIAGELQSEENLYYLSRVRPGNVATIVTQVTQ